jgi:hypothetical protein
MNALSKQPGMFYKFLIAGIVLTGMGGWIISKSNTAAEARQEKVVLERLEQGSRPKSRWIKTSGQLLWDHAVEESGRRTRIGNVYVPLVSDRWEPGDKVAAFVQISTLEEDEFDDQGIIEGTTGLSGMSSQVRALFRRELGIEAASVHIVIDAGATPQSEGRAGRICLVFGIVLLGICGVMLLLATAEGADGDIKEGLYTKQRLAELREQSNPQGENSCDAAVQEWMKDRGFQTTHT